MGNLYFGIVLIILIFNDKAFLRFVNYFAFFPYYSLNILGHYYKQMSL